MDLVEGTARMIGVVWRWIKWLFFLSVLAAVGYACFILFANYSEGARTGYVVKISKRGVLFKTNEGELNFGFPQVNTAPGVLSQNTWNFSVPDDRVAEQIQKAAESGQKVTLFYRQKYKQLFFRGDTEYLVYRIEKSAEYIDSK